MRLTRCRDGYEHDPEYPLGHYMSWSSEAVPGVRHLLVREVAMMKVMDQFTDKPDWHREIFDDAVVEKWAAEALEIPVRELYREIVGGRGRGRNYALKALKRNILDKDCLDYVCPEYNPHTAVARGLLTRQLYV